MENHKMWFALNNVFKKTHLNDNFYRCVFLYVIRLKYELTKWKKACIIKLENEEPQNVVCHKVCFKKTHLNDNFYRCVFLFFVYLSIVCIQ